jgi:hypothetical protein
VRHRERALAGPGQEVGDESVEPEIVVVAVARPQAERAVGALAVISRSIACLMRPSRSGSIARCSIDGELVGVEQRHRAADGLLRAAIGIALERLQQGRRIERAERRGGDARSSRCRE